MFVGIVFIENLEFIFCIFKKLKIFYKVFNVKFYEYEVDIVV